jgi:hypothetical protein
MNRVARFVAGRPYFLLGVTPENVGSVPARYTFLYGDEPWVGNFGEAFNSGLHVPDGVFAPAY